MRKTDALFSVPTVRVSQTTRNPVIPQGLRRTTFPKALSTKFNTKWVWLLWYFKSKIVQNASTNIIHNQLTFQAISQKYYSTANDTTTKTTLQQTSQNPTPPPFDPASVQPKSSTTMKEVIQDQPALLSETVPKISSGYLML